MFDDEELRELGQRLAATDPRAASDDELSAAAVALERLRSLVELSTAGHAAELDQRAVTDREHGLRTGLWLARETGASPATTRAQVRLGLLLRDRFPRLAAAVAAGELSWDHVRVLAAVTNRRVIDAVAELQDEIIGLARDCGFEQWKTEVHALVTYLDQDGAEPDPSDRNRLTTGRDARRGHPSQGHRHEGSRARHPPGDQHQGRRAVLPLHPRPRRHPRSPGPVAARAQRVGAGRTAAPRRRRRHRPGSRPAARGHPGPAPRPAHRHRGRPDPGAGRGVVGMRPDLVPVVLDSFGIPLDVGHAQRLATATQRRAIALRDGGCVFPGCDQPIAWCDAHHVDHWIHRGRTDLANLAGCCRHHHGVVHRPGWIMKTTPDGWCWFITPSGDRFWSQRHFRRRAGPTPDVERHPTSPTCPPPMRWNPTRGYDPPGCHCDHPTPARAANPPGEAHEAA